MQITKIRNGYYEYCGFYIAKVANRQYNVKTAGANNTFSFWTIKEAQAFIDTIVSENA